VYAVGGSAYVPPVASALVTPLRGIQDRAPAGTTINYAQGAAPIGQQPDAPELPLLATPMAATYFGTPDWTGPAVLTQTESGVNLNGGIPNPSVAPGAANGSGGTIKANGWSVRYSSAPRPSSGLYVFSLGDGGVGEALPRRGHEGADARRAVRLRDPGRRAAHRGPGRRPARGLHATPGRARPSDRRRAR
jgi:hypothetical protein